MTGTTPTGGIGCSGPGVSYRASFSLGKASAGPAGFRVSKATPKIASTRRAGGGDTTFTVSLLGLGGGHGARDGPVGRGTVGDLDIASGDARKIARAVSPSPSSEGSAPDSLLAEGFLASGVNGEGARGRTRRRGRKDLGETVSGEAGVLVGDRVKAKRCRIERSLEELLNGGLASSRARRD